MEKLINEKTFIEILRSHKRILYKIINLYCKDKEDRVDLEQEIIIQLWKSFPVYNPKFQYSTFIYRIALNVAISHLRKGSRRKRNETYLDSSIFNFQEEAAKPLEEEVALLYKFIEELDN